MHRVYILEFNKDKESQSAICEQEFSINWWMSNLGYKTVFNKLSGNILFIFAEK